MQSKKVFMMKLRAKIVLRLINRKSSMLLMKTMDAKIKMKAIAMASNDTTYNKDEDIKERIGVNGAIEHCE